jgi:hypothetical protein
MLFVLLLAVLIVGTLQIDLLTNPWFDFSLPLDMPDGIMRGLARANLDLQGALLITLLIILAPVAFLGLEQVHTRFNRWTYASFSLLGLTLLLAAPVVSEGTLRVGLTGRFFFEAFLLIAIVVVGILGFSRDDIAGWLWETWRFVKQIFPLLIAGVFAAGMVKAVLPEEWVQTLAGRNTLGANLVGVLFGVFMYFPTLVEVPIARMFLDLGMHRGPLLAYLLADPELSLQSILVTGRLLGKKKTGAYVILVTIFSTLAGYIFGGLMTLF